MDIARILRQRGQYDPLAFPDTGPDKVALRLQAQGAPGGPPRAGSCTTRIRCIIFGDGAYVKYHAETMCGRRGREFRGRDVMPINGEDAQKRAEHDAEVRFKNHICS